jgi:hypothetical protein
MSLINDALKRAKQVQPPAASSQTSQLHFRPVEANHTARHGFGLMMPVAFALVALLVLFLGWELAQQNAATKQAASGGQSELVARAASPTTGSQSPAAAPAPPAPPVADPAPPTPSKVEPPTTTDSSEPPAATPAVADATPPTPDIPAAPPKPVLRLQSIVFDPAHPSAMINGKIVFLGDKVGEFRISAITQTSATLFNSSQTNTLELGE